MASDPSFEAGAPMDSLSMVPAMSSQPTTPASAGTPAAPTKKLVDVYTAMLFVAALFLLVGSLALAWEKQRYGDLFGNTWKIPPDYKVSAIERVDDIETDRFFRV